MAQPRRFPPPWRLIAALATESRAHVPPTSLSQRGIVNKFGSLAMFGAIRRASPRDKVKLQQ